MTFACYFCLNMLLSKEYFEVNTTKFEFNFYLYFYVHFTFLSRLVKIDRLTEPYLLMSTDKDLINVNLRQSKVSSFCKVVALLYL